MVSGVLQILRPIGDHNEQFIEIKFVQWAKYKVAWFLGIFITGAALPGFAAESSHEMKSKGDDTPSHWDGAKRRPVSWPSPPLRISIENYNLGESGPEFSIDSKFICVWNFPTNQDYKFRPATYPVSCVVFNIDGQQQKDATDERGFLKGGYKLIFPKTFRRQTYSNWLVNFGTTTSEEAVLTANLSPDNRLAVRIVAKKKDVDSSWGKGFKPIVEMRRLSATNELAWSISIPEKAFYTRGLVDFFKKDEREFILAAFEDNYAFILSAEDGKIVDSFSYGPEETAAELAVRRKLWGLKSNEDDIDVQFKPFQFAFDPMQRILALGSANDLRIRILSIDAPHNILFEAHSNDSPRDPKPGDWNIMSLRFDAHKYITAGYLWAGRKNGDTLDCEEVISTSSLVTVWSASNDKISLGSPYVSPDGKTMAVVREKWLEIGPTPFP